MKTKIIWIAMLLLTCTALTYAQTSKKHVWKELKTFHGFMSTSFHPAEEGNFAPLRQKADSMLTAAKSWQASPVPADFKPAETKIALDKLVAQCTAVKKAVDDKSANEALLKLITEAHDIFHTIVGECRKAED